ncbi:mitotic checkpoint protein-domain-containing protein [Tribonema minus]|uniref:Mitotic checkpoint protein-domain-containing protein n=1 Tax=Tribonema minus TaxID=303371 RepID=A0A835Z2S9_9STRA|nr:mitotic checkpoint protein-domain-containing protein [Tribonema minus]
MLRRGDPRSRLVGQQQLHYDRHILTVINKEISAFLDHVLPSFAPSYVPPALREARLREQVTALQAKLDSLTEPPASASNKRLRSTYDAGSALVAQQVEAERLRTALEQVKLERDKDSHRHAKAVGELESEKQRLTRQITFLVSQEQAAVEELQTKQAQWLDEKLRLMDEKQRSSEQLLSLQQQVESLAHGATATRTGAAEQASARVQHVEATAAALKAELDRTKSALDSMSAEKAALQSKLRSAQEQAQHAPSALRLRDVETSLREREARLAQREDVCACVVALQDEAAGLRTQLDKAREYVSAAETVKLELEVLKEVQGEWVRLFTQVAAGAGLAGYTECTPAEAIAVVQKLQQDHAALLSRCMDAKSHLTLKTEEARASAKRAEHEAAAAKALRVSLTEAQSALRLERSARDTHAAELAALREVLDTYSADPTVKGRWEGEARVAAEKALAAAKDELRQLRARLAEGSSVPSGVADALRERVAEVEREAARAAAARDAQERRCEALEAELARHEHRVGLGEFDPAVTKVLHFSRNPAAIAAGKRAEGAKDKELEDLRRVQENLQEQMYAQKSQFFRRAVTHLMGYKVDLNTEKGNPQIKLHSIYSDHEDDYLLFQWVDGQPQLLMTPLTNRLERKVFTYLSTCNSIPAFLASIILDQFEKQTFQVG